jgi:hypothetical protein
MEFPDPYSEYGSGGAKNALNFAKKDKKHPKNDLLICYDFFIRRKTLLERYLISY